MSGSPRRAIPWAVLLVLALAAGARAPFLRLWLCGEEGNFASAVRDVTRLRKPRLLIARNLQGQPFTTVPGHNLGGYAVPALLAGPVRAIAGFRTDAQRARYGILLRGCFLALWTGALALAALTIAPAQRLAGSALLLGCSLFTVPLLGSVQIQYDGAVSTLLLVAMTALLTARPDRPAMWALAGLLVSIGKLEMAAVAFAAAAITAIAHRSVRGLAAFTGALLAGFTACWLIDRENFLGGYAVPQRFWGMKEASGLPLVERVRRYLALMLPLLWPAFAAVIAGGLAFVVSPHRRRAVTALSIAAGLCLGYALIAWEGDGFPRYFAPVFLLAPLAIALCEPPRWVLGGLGALALACAAPGYLAERALGNRAMCGRLHGSDGRAALRVTPPVRPTCVPVTDSESAPGFYSATAPFACCWSQWADWPGLAPQLCR